MHSSTFLSGKDTQEDPTNSYENLTLSLQTKNNNEWWQLKHYQSSDEHAAGEISMLAFVDKVFPSTFNMVAGAGYSYFFLYNFLLFKLSKGIFAILIATCR